MDDYMGTKESAKVWGVKQSTVAQWCRDRRLKCGTQPCTQDKKGSPWRIRRDAIPPNKKESSN